LTRSDHGRSWLIIIAFAALVIMHIIFWTVTQPVNKFWLRNQSLTKLGERFFGRDSMADDSAKDQGQGSKMETDWRAMRDRWEYSHLVRALLSIVALVTLTIAVVRA
jgi:hypothetical protein